MNDFKGDGEVHISDGYEQDTAAAAAATAHVRLLPERSCLLGGRSAAIGQRDLLLVRILCH